ncbi:MAG: 4-hydroxy-3-methylbut-2-enyl diphosphate reductase, partial [Pseudomonadales bacterium]|nr:4-hydroxy-3-methylbut-2-enyl diphosphate reductase [Pseudomonadales bacterium]NIX07839.1 4-hydroxy-3-methylbut-2-enyl diphosphate reductase [Pseudomonadales bacterium]
VRELAELGYDPQDVNELVRLKIHGVKPELVRELRAAGYTELSVEEVVRLNTHGVSPR